MSLFPAGIFLFFGGIAFVSGVARLFQTRFLTTLKQRHIVSVTPGINVLKGNVTIEDPLIASLSGKKCAYYMYELRDDSKKEEAIINIEEKSRPFYLSDGTGVIKVDLTGASVNILTHEEFKLDKPQMTAWLNKIDNPKAKVKLQRWLKDKKNVIEEYVMVKPPVMGMIQISKRVNAAARFVKMQIVLSVVAGFIFLAAGCVIFMSQR